MKWFKPNNEDEKVIKLLSESRQGFMFDEKNVKASLMLKLEKKPSFKRDPIPHHFIPKYYAGLVASIVLVGSVAGISYASNQAKPGETLFSVQKIQNNIVLSLPLPADQKAQFRTDIVAQRLDELDHLQTSVTSPATVSAEVQASGESIKNAVSNIEQIQKQAAQNNSKALSILQQLDELSNKHQQRLESLKDATTDEKIKMEIEKSIKDIQTSRNKLKN